MNRFREMLKDNSFMRGSFFILFNAFLLYVLFFTIKNFGDVLNWCGNILGILLSILTPLVIGLILAYLMNPLVTIIDTKALRHLFPKSDDPKKAARRTGTSRLISIFLTLLLILAAFVALLYALAVIVIGQVSFTSISNMVEDLIASLMSYEEAFKGWIAKNVPDGLLAEKLADLATWLIGWIGKNISATSVIGFFAGIGGGIINFVIGIILAIYLLKDRELFLRIWDKFLQLVFPRRGAIISGTLTEINGVLSLFLRGALLDALIVAILSSVGLSIMGLEAAVFIGVFAGICNIIPYFGPVMGMIPAFLMGFFTEGFWHGAIAVIILLVIQQIDSNVIYPKVVGSSTGLHPLVVLLAITIFGYLFGIIGMLLAVPLTGIIQIFVLKLIRWREKKVTTLYEDSSE